MVMADQIKEPEMSLKTWMALVGLTLSTFIFNTSEFIPIALLTDIGRDFGLTEAKAGMLISVYAWVVMILSMPLMLMTSKMEMRKLLLGVVAVFTSFQVMSYLSTSFGMLMFPESALPAPIQSSGQSCRSSLSGLFRRAISP